MIKAVIFDWGGVLIDDPAPYMVSYCAYSLGVSEESFLNIYKKFSDDFQRGVLSEHILWDKVCKELKIKKPNAASLWGDAFRHVYSPKEKMFSLVSELHDKGYKVGFLSNTELPAMKYFYEKAYDVFDTTVFSCKEGTIKPERRIYEIILDKLDVKPHEAIFIDDKEKYLEGAKELGINTILFISLDQVKKELNFFLAETIKKSK